MGEGGVPSWLTNVIFLLVLLVVLLVIVGIASGKLGDLWITIKNIFTFGGA